MIAAVIRAQIHIRREKLSNLRDFVAHARNDIARIFSFAHQDNSLDQIVLVIAPQDSETDRMANAGLSDVSDADRCSFLSSDDDVLNILCRLDEPDAADHQRVFALRNVTSTGVGVVGGDGIENLFHGQVVSAEPRWIDRDLILLDTTAP